jgi:orotate phosphoribosyltransferase
MSLCPWFGLAGSLATAPPAGANASITSWAAILHPAWTRAWETVSQTLTVRRLRLQRLLQPMEMHMAQSDARARLIEIIRARSVHTGTTFTLASGRTSDFYCNLKPTMLDPEGAYLLGELIAAAAEKLAPDFIGGLELGAVPLATAATASSFRHGHAIPAFFVRKQVKGHGTNSLVEGLVKGATLAGKRVMILEDVTTTGGSSLKAIEAVRAEGAEVVGVLTVVDREEGAAETFAAAKVPFSALIVARELR